MNFLSFIFPRKVAILSSPYNNVIRVNEEMGRMKLLVNGSPQSGKYIAMLWNRAFRSFGLLQSHLQGDPLQILVLGVAGGTVIDILHSYYPQACITGVDIDQTMIDVGIKYFGLGQINNLTLVRQDAQAYVTKNVKLKRFFDIIIVDIYIGAFIPELVRNKLFLHNLLSSLSDRGHLVINYLQEFEYSEKSNQLYSLLKTMFPRVVEKPLYNNRFFLASMIKSKDV